VTIKGSFYSVPRGKSSLCRSSKQIAWNSWLILLSRSTSEQKKNDYFSLISSRIRNTSAEVKKEIELQIGMSYLSTLLVTRNFPLAIKTLPPIS